MSELLSIYLRDHHASAGAGVRLARRMVEHTLLAPAYRDELATVAAEIEEDFGSLESIMAALDVDPSTTKDTVAAAGERIGRLKGNGRVFERSALSDVLELETLCAGITAKEALWRSLEVSGREVPTDTDLDRLIQRAGRQRQAVEGCRVEAARLAFVAP